MNKKKREEIKILLSVLPKKEVRNILISGEKPWKAAAITSIFISAIFACAAANAFSNNNVSDGIFSSSGVLMSLGLVLLNITTMDSAKKKQLYYSMINQHQLQIVQTHSAIIKNIQANLEYALAIASGKQPEAKTQKTPSIKKLADKSDLLLKMKNKSYKKMLLEIRKFNPNNTR